MKHNISFIEVVIRLIITMAFTMTSWLSGFFFFFPIAMILVVTALSGYFPIYSVLGKDTSIH